MTTKRDHRGIAYHHGVRHEAIGHKVDPSTPDPRRAVCKDCGRRVHFVRRTHARAAHWQHTGDGLVQYRSW